MRIQLYPAIDLREGRCVRLIQGDFSRGSIYGDDPAAQAAAWVGEGATYLHVVDLDAAKAGAARNKPALKAILDAVNIPVQTGGGVRTIKDVDDRLDMGASRVIIGSAAIYDLPFLEEAVKRYGDKIVVGIDAVNGKAAGGGWIDVSGVSALSLCATVAECGVKRVIYTDIMRDGTMSGPNIQETTEIVEASGCEVIASGGVASLDDIERVIHTGASGVIIGSALYRGAFDLSDAVALYQNK
jgi:phosphoribosylformimino-5-aminoimidazole carboxamide ribotide isomerase